MNRARLILLATLLGLLVTLTGGATATAGPTQGVSGRVLGPGRSPLGEVTVVAVDADGDEVGTAQTDPADGSYEIGVPAAGTYTVQVDVGTLPDGLVIVEPEAEVEVSEGRMKGVPPFVAVDEDEAPAPPGDGEPGGGDEAPVGRQLSFRGTIRTPDDPATPDVDEAGPIPGVLIVVTDADGEEVASAETDEDGNFLIPLPEPGTYTATLDQSTLPDGVALTNPDQPSRTFEMSGTTSQPLLFGIGEGSAATGNLAKRALQTAVLGLSFGLVIALAAVGLSMIFGTTGLTNFAHGELVTFGALAAYFFNVRIGMPLPIAAPLAMVVGGLAGGLFELGVWRPLRRRGTGLIAMLVVSLGLAIFFRFVFLNIFLGRSRPYSFQWGSRARSFGPVTMAPKDLLSMAVCIVVLVGVGLLLQRTRVGKAMRAVADNPSLAASSGINVDRVVLLVWVLAGGLATLGGILFGVTQEGISFQVGFQLLLLMFAGVTLGGLGTAFGALVGCVIVGMLVQMSTLVISPELKNVGALVVLVLILLVRPQGILGRAERIG